jgi:hypothetical protein
LKKKYFFGLFFSFAPSQKNAKVCPDLSCAPSISPYFFGFCWKTDHYSYKWSLDKNKTHEKEEKNNLLPCFMQNVAKTVLIHFLTNLNLKDLSQDVGIIFLFYLLVNAYKNSDKIQKLIFCIDSYWKWFFSKTESKK